MTNRGGLSTWSLKELLEAERRWNAFAMDATELRAEIARRRAHQTQAYVMLGVILVAVAAVVAVASLFLH
jgi:hypothetical protein